MRVAYGICLILFGLGLAIPVFIEPGFFIVYGFILYFGSAVMAIYYFTTLCIELAILLKRKRLEIKKK